MKALNIDAIVKNMTSLQKYKYNNIARQRDGKKRQLEYALSFLGISNGDLRYHLDKIKTDFDTNEGMYSKSKVFKAGELNRLFDDYKRTMTNADKFKTPLLKSYDYIGVEIECLIPRDNFDNDYECECTCESNCGCGDDDCQSYHDDCSCGQDDAGYVKSVKRSLTRKAIKGVQAVTDGSIADESGDMFGVEIKVLFRENDWTSLEQVCKWLNENDAIVNKSCGLHVHLDARNHDDDSIRNFIDRFSNALPFINKMVPKSRVNNSYCKNQASFSDRYSAVNGESFEKHKTIEIRLHTGSTNFQKIKNWISLLTLVKKSAALEANEPNNLTEFFNMVGIDSELETYCVERMIKFNASWLDEQGFFRLVSDIQNENHEDSENEQAA